MITMNVRRQTAKLGCPNFTGRSTTGTKQQIILMTPIMYVRVVAH